MTEHEIRYTAYVGLIPVGHGATPAKARLSASKNGCPVVERIVKRLKAYPFTHLEEDSDDD